jgi:TolA-binding protein
MSLINGGRSADGDGEGKLMRKALIISLIGFMPGCAALMEGLSSGSGSPKTQNAEQLLAEGNFTGAREVWQRIARDRKGSEAGERAAYRAALTLVHPKNPARNYRNAANEFETLLQDYPSGKHAGEAVAWISATEIIEQTR